MVGSSETKKIDHLKEDDPIPGQRFVCISFVSPEGIKNCTTRGLKIRGVYQTYEEAQERCKELQVNDPNFDIFVGEVGKWLPWDPDPNSAKDQKYQEEQLQQIVDGYNQNLNKAKKMQQERKEDMLAGAAKNELSKKDKRIARMRQKLEEKKAKERMQNMAKEQMEGIIPDNLSSKINDLSNQEKLAKDERSRLVDNQQKLESQKENVSNITDQLSKIQALYNSINKKKQSEK